MNSTIALQCAGLSQQVYESFPQVTFESAPTAQKILVDEPSTDTQAAILDEPEADRITVVFRGTTNWRDWQTNFGMHKQNISSWLDTLEQDLVVPYEVTRPSVKVHKGFIKAYRSVRERIQNHVYASSSRQIIVAGHSLGAALATLCGVDLQYNLPAGANKTLAVYTYGSPRVGNEEFVQSYDQRVPETFRFVYGRDIVTRVPRWWQNYRHVGKEIKLGPWFSLNVLSRRIEDHDIKKYIAALQA